MVREPRPHGAADHRAPRTHTGAAAALVATGILASRVLGLIRNSLIARYLGTTVAADAWTAAFKVPNTLQNLFGEGALSAAFVPVYARLLGAGEDAEADRVAGAVAAILGLTIAVFVLVGILAAPQLIYAIAPGFSGARRALTVTLTRILFPGAGFLALSAWCLGVLNSHRKFLIAYTAPIAWNLSLIVALLWWGPGADKAHVVTVMAWASVCGSMLQFAVQLPAVRKVAPRLRVAFEATSTNVREIIRNFGPAFVSRGVVQISSFIDQILTSFLPIGMAAVFGFANTLYLLPVSMFGAAISVAELPEMSRATAEEHEAGRHAAAAHRRRTAADRVPRCAVGRGVRHAGRRAHPRRVRARAFHRHRRRVHLGRACAARPSGCWPARWGGCIRPPTTRSATRGRRCGSR